MRVNDFSLVFGAFAVVLGIVLILRDLTLTRRAHPGPIPRGSTIKGPPRRALVAWGVALLGIILLSVAK